HRHERDRDESKGLGPAPPHHRSLHSSFGRNVVGLGAARPVPVDLGFEDAAEAASPLAGSGLVPRVPAAGRPALAPPDAEAAGAASIPEVAGSAAETIGSGGAADTTRPGVAPIAEALGGSAIGWFSAPCPPSGLRRRSSPAPATAIAATLAATGRTRRF